MVKNGVSLGSSPRHLFHTKTGGFNDGDDDGDGGCFGRALCGCGVNELSGLDGNYSGDYCYIGGARNHSKDHENGWKRGMRRISS